jgi:hypothetical protein
MVMDRVLVGVQRLRQDMDMATVLDMATVPDTAMVLDTQAGVLIRIQESMVVTFTGGILHGVAGRTHSLVVPFLTLHGID